eukprot:g3438.t1
MPGPGGGGGFGGGGGGFGGGPGGFGGGRGGFGGPGFGGPGFGGPGFRGGGFWGPGWGFGGPGFGWPFFWGGPAVGPWGLPWCWWPILVLLIPYIILATLGVVLIQYAFSWCTTDTPDGSQTDEDECAGYEALWAIGLAIVMGVLFCCCFCRRREEGTAAEHTPILASEAPPPPPARAYAVDASAPYETKTPVTVSSYADKST